MTPPAARRTTRSAGARRRGTVAEQVLADDETTLLDLVDNALTKGVVLTGDLTLGLAQIDLVYARLSLLLCAADRVMPGEHHDPIRRRRQRVGARGGRRGSLAEALTRPGERAPGARTPRGDGG